MREIREFGKKKDGSKKGGGHVEIRLEMTRLLLLCFFYRSGSLTGLFVNYGFIVLLYYICALITLLFHPCSFHFISFHS